MHRWLALFSPNTLQRGEGHWLGNLSALDRRPTNQGVLNVSMLDPRAADGTLLVPSEDFTSRSSMSVEHRRNIISGRRGLWSHATLLMLGTYCSHSWLNQSLLLVFDWHPVADIDSK